MSTADRVRTSPAPALGPADHGRPLTFDQFDGSQQIPGWKYELIDGRLFVSPEPNFAESVLENWLFGRLYLYRLDHPDVINYVTTKSRVYVPDRAAPTAPEPDLSAYHGLDLDRDVRTVHWRDLAPLLVGEILVEGDGSKDLDRNPGLYFAVPSVQEYWVIDGRTDPNEPSLIQHRRRGKTWAVTTFPYQSAFTTPLLPGFALTIDPRK